VSRSEDHFSLPEVDHPGLARQVRRQKTLHQLRKRAKVARLRHERLQIAFGREDPVEF